MRVTHQQVLFDESKRTLYLVNKQMENSLILKITNAKNLIDQNLRESALQVQQSVVKSQHQMDAIDSRFDLISQFIQRNIDQVESSIVMFDERFLAQATRVINLKKERLNDILKSLKYRSPLDVIQRNLNQGYVIPRIGNEHILRAESIEINDEMLLEFKDGIVTTQVISKESKDE